MRAIRWIFVSVVAFSAVASAQTPAKFTGFEPYEFGINIDAARGTASTAGWKVEPSQGKTTNVAGGPPLVLANMPFDVRLEFVDQQLTGINLSNSISAGTFEICAERYRRLLTAIAGRIGPIEAATSPRPMLYRNAGATGMDVVAQPQRLPQPDGSTIWQYERPGVGPSDYRSQKLGDGFAVNLLAHWESSECLLSAYVANTALRDAIFERSRLAQEAARLQPPPALSATDVARIRAAQETDFARLRLTRLPSAAEHAAAYPTRALAREREGSATLTCLLESNGAFVCVVDAEDPAGWDFGSAALALSTLYRANPAAEHVGKRFELPVQFRVRRRK